MKHVFTFIALTALFTLQAVAQTPTKHVSVGDSVPLFTLPDQDGVLFSVKEQLKKNVLVIFFYPKDDTPNATRQVNGFRDRFKEFEEEGVQIAGINPGPVEKHKAFHDKNKLPFPLLSDKDSEVVNRFGIKSTLGLINRETYVVDTNGKIVFFLDAFADGARHAEEVLNYLQSQD